MFGADKGNVADTDSRMDGKQLCIGIVQARFNAGVTDALAAACKQELLAQFDGTARPAHAPERGRMDLRTYGVGAQILRLCGVHKMRLMGSPRRMPSLTGYGLETVGYLSPTAA